MRIVGGTARGRRLGVPAKGTRPTSDRVREALFSSVDVDLVRVGGTWADVRALDLFAGSGALGLEAASRGAGGVLLVERSRAAVATIRENIAAVGLPGVELLVRDVQRLAELPAPTPPFTLVLADPPYDVDSAAVAGALSGLRAGGWIADGALVVVERAASDAASPIPGDWVVDRMRDYGDTRLWYGRAAVMTDGVPGTVARTAGEGGA